MKNFGFNSSAFSLKILLAQICKYKEKIKHNQIFEYAYISERGLKNDRCLFVSKPCTTVWRIWTQNFFWSEAILQRRLWRQCNVHVLSKNCRCAKCCSSVLTIEGIHIVLYCTVCAQSLLAQRSMCSLYAQRVIACTARYGQVVPVLPLSHHLHSEA